MSGTKTRAHGRITGRTAPRIAARQHRHLRVRKKVEGSAVRPRLVVTRGKVKKGWVREKKWDGREEEKDRKEKKFSLREEIEARKRIATCYSHNPSGICTKVTNNTTVQRLAQDPIAAQSQRTLTTGL